MGMIAPAYVTLNPSYMMPEIIMPYAQASGAFETLGGSGEPLVRLTEGDLVAYIRRLDLRTKMAAGQSAYNELPSVGVIASMISTASYLLRIRGEYDHHDTAAAGRWNVALPAAQRKGMRQAHFQLLRNMLLYGMNPANGEGLLNTNGATAVNLPADSNGNDTVLTYDNGQMAFFLLGQIAALKSRTNQLGLGQKFIILGPQRDLSVWEYQGIVQLVQFQRIGAGSNSTAGTVKEVLTWNGDTVLWCYDDTLIGQGAGGNDAIIMVMPEVEVPTEDGINTNEFATLQPGLEACTLQLTDMNAPREIPTPLPGGAIDVLTELRATSGWAVRPEAISILSMQYQ